MLFFVAIANFEYYSSTTRDFELLGSQRSSKSGWISLGHFQAGTQQGHQRFRVTTPVWVRYLQLRLNSHHGNEHFCTLTQVKVHGMDVLEALESIGRLYLPMSQKSTH
eukprot:2986233-Pyramimonas_sp.AAC.2